METLPADKVAEIRKIALPQGGELEVTMSQEFIDRLRQHYGLFGDQQPDDDQVRMYVWGSLNNAVAKAELEMRDAEPAGGVRQPDRREEDAGS